MAPRNVLLDFVTMAIWGREDWVEKGTLWGGEGSLGGGRGGVTALNGA